MAFFPITNQYDRIQPINGLHKLQPIRVEGCVRSILGIRSFSYEKALTRSLIWNGE